MRAAFIDPDRWHFLPDTLPSLDRLGTWGWTHVFLTNHIPEVGKILEHLGLSAHLAAVFNSAETGSEKPHPQVFRNVLNRFRPETAWMVGDNPVADVAGAEAVGLPAVLVRKQDPGVQRAFA